MKISDLNFYIAGPMTNKEHFNYPLFTEAAEHVRLATGATVISPHELDHGDDGILGSIPYEEYLRTDIEQLLTCDAIVLLPGWGESKGASLEREIALALNFYFFSYSSSYRAGKLLTRMRVGRQDVLE